MSEIDETKPGESVTYTQVTSESSPPEEPIVASEPSTDQKIIPSDYSTQLKENGDGNMNHNGEDKAASGEGDVEEPAAKKLKTNHNGSCDDNDKERSTPSVNGSENDIKQEDKEKDKEPEEEKTEEKTELDKRRDHFAQEVQKKELASLERKKAAEKCPECTYMCWTDAEMKIHRQTSHGSAPRRLRLCGNCSYTCQNTWEMDYHTRSRGHKAKEVITCKKCDFLCDTKEESWEHKKVHIPKDKLFECGDCNWCSERLDNMRYHEHSQEHKTKIDYEAIAKSKAEEKGPKELKHYLTKLAKDIKKAKAAMPKK